MFSSNRNVHKNLVRGATVLLVFTMASLYIYGAVRKIVSSALCYNGGMVNGLELRCSCSHVPHFDDGQACRTCMIDPRVGRCVDDPSAPHGSSSRRLPCGARCHT